MRLKHLLSSLLVIIILLSPVTVLSQHKGTVEYGLEIGIDENNENGTYQNVQEKAQDGAHKLHFQLKYNDDEALFHLKKGIQNNDGDAFMAKAVSTYFSPIYTNLSQENVTYHNQESPAIGIKKDEFLVTDSLFGDWDLKNETKKIQGFTCYKATGTLHYFELGKTKIKQLIAWYCPEIPNSFGPMGYGGLPGLILELQIDEVLFGAKKLHLQENNIEIKKPTEGKSVTTKEMDSIKKVAYDNS